MKVVLYALKGNNGRAEHVALAMQEGLKRHGIAARVETQWRGEVLGDFAIAYGWTHQPVFTAYRAAGGGYAYWDLGYWNRSPGKGKGGSREGSYRLGLNSWDTADGMRRGCPSDRWDTSGIELQESPGTCSQLAMRPILVLGMSPKAARTHGLRTDAWEVATIAKLRELDGPRRQIMFRPKAKLANMNEPIARALRGCGLAVMHHSNVAVDALIQGVPVYAVKGVGRLFSHFHLSSMAADKGPMLTTQERVAILSDIAYSQWTASEMRSGLAWAHIQTVL